MEKHDRNDEGSVNPSGLLRIYDLPYIIWLFTESNFPTFVVPNTTFGMLGALAGHGLTTQSSPGFEKLLMRLPLIILFNWATVFIFDLANQRLPESVQEDLANKPWRPIPTGKVTREQTRRGMLIAIPLVLALNTAMGVWRETSLIFVLTWLYNDLKGGDEIIRDLIISVAFGLYNHASLKLAVDADTEITQQGYIWITLISGVILTTMQVQDLKDQAGDKGRDRRTIPLVFGDSFSRWSIAWLVLLWSPICVLFWGLNLWAYAVPMSIGFYLVFQVLGKRDVKADAKAWRLWCLWMMVLYVLPVIYCSQTVIS